MRLLHLRFHAGAFFLAANLIRHVDLRSHDTHCHAVSVTHQHGTRRHVALDAVRPEHPYADDLPLTGGEDLLPHLLSRRPVVRMHEVEARQRVDVGTTIVGLLEAEHAQELVGTKHRSRAQVEVEAADVRGFLRQTERFLAASQILERVALLSHILGRTKQLRGTAGMLSHQSGKHTQDGDVAVAARNGEVHCDIFTDRCTVRQCAPPFGIARRQHLSYAFDVERFDGRIDSEQAVGLRTQPDFTRTDNTETADTRDFLYSRQHRLALLQRTFSATSIGDIF